MRRVVVTGLGAARPPRPRRGDEIVPVLRSRLHLQHGGWRRGDDAGGEGPERHGESGLRAGDADAVVAGAVVLEPRDVAERRGATILAELAGYGTRCDAFHPTRPEPSAEGCARCMRLAHEPRTAELRAVLSNSFAFGGINASLVFRKA
jgi:hypothetical protein